MSIAIVPISIIGVDTQINPIVSFYVSSNVIVTDISKILIIQISDFFL